MLIQSGKNMTLGRFKNLLLTSLVFFFSFWGKNCIRSFYRIEEVKKYSKPSEFRQPHIYYQSQGVTQSAI